MRSVAEGDGYSLAEDSVLNVDATAGVLSNDYDVDGDSMTAAHVDGPSNGSLSFNADGSFSYTPDTDFNGMDSFTYVVNDGFIDSTVATVDLNVGSVNDTPSANDTDVDGDTLAASLASQPANGILNLNANGSFTYTPASDFNGTDSFTYSVNDGQADSNVATVTITIGAIDDDPRPTDDTYGAKQGVALAIAPPGVLINDRDPEGQRIRAALVSSPGNGSLAFNADGRTFQGPGLPAPPRTSLGIRRGVCIPLRIMGVVVVGNEWKIRCRGGIKMWSKENTGRKPGV